MDIKSSPELLPFLLTNVVKTGVTLGMGSFGCVEEVSMNGAPCAGKKLHDSLMHPRNESELSLVKKLVSECRLMSELKHPNIVQFFGLYFFENSKFPTIVMEKLHSNLDAVLSRGKDIPMSLKIIFMQDIAKGLNYLHTQVPPIIHRDLTARNVLLTSSMMAKLGDLGNSRILPFNEISSSLTQMPGTLVYMPPEALRPSPNYDTSLDMFSFGHLILYIILQELPWNMLAYTYPDPNNPNKLIARSEVERRKEYIDRCVLTVGNKNPIIMLASQCLSDHPQARPTAEKMLGKLLESEHKQKEVFGDIRRRLNLHSTEVLGSSYESSFEASTEQNSLDHQMLQQIAVS